MEIQKELGSFKTVATAKGWSIDGETTQTNYRFHCLTTQSGWEMWQAAQAHAVPYESCSRKSHEIIINETKNELIDGYDIAKEDEYLLESLVFLGVCIGVAVTTPHLPEWISIDEHLPDEGQEVLVHHFGHIVQATRDQNWSGGFKQRNCYGWEAVSSYISHWMPTSLALPKEYHFYYEHDAKKAQEQGDV